MDTLLAIIGLAQSIYGKWMSRRFFHAAIVGLSLAIVTAAMMGAMLIGSFFAIYLLLVHYGVETQNALLIVGGMGLFTTLLLLFITTRYLQSLRTLPQRLMEAKAPQLSHVSEQLNDVINAFMDGFQATRKK